MLILPGAARADAQGLFGDGARSAGLARADLTGAPSDAPRQNAALAAEPGVRLRLGYGYAGLHLTLDGRDAQVEHASGFDLAAQLGARLSETLRVGAALSLHLPDQHLALIGFRPATEPQFVLYESPLQRVSVDMVAALRYRALSLGGGLSAGLSVSGNGTSFDLGQDAHGTFADAALDVALPYRFAPLAGLRLDLGRVKIGASFRGALAVDLRLDSEVRIHLRNNPLNGSTTVNVSGPSGWDPATIALGAKVALGLGFSAIGALEYAVYSAAPAPIADVHIDVSLGTTPGQREARFPAPRFHDTIAPRLGIELTRPIGERGRTWSARLAYALAPSPVPAQTSFTSYADATRHQIALGSGYRFGRVLGVDVSADLAFQLHLFTPRVEEKSPALPFARYEVGGRILHGAATIEAAWE
ncbi:MAG: hypothetical protein ABI193_00660 [Minicystis sp.]